MGDRARGGLEEVTDGSQVLAGSCSGYAAMQEDSRTAVERKAVRQVPKSSMSRGGQEASISRGKRQLESMGTGSRGRQGSGNEPGPGPELHLQSSGRTLRSFSSSACAPPPELSGKANCHIGESPEQNTHCFLIS